MSRGYEHFLESSGFTENSIQSLMARLPPPIPNPLVDEAWELFPSPISGYGLRSRREISEGEQFPVCLGTERYLTARYVNHSDSPTVAFRFSSGGRGWMVALQPIPARFEVTANYSDTLAASLAAS